MKALQFKDVSFSYVDGKNVIENVSFEVDEGEFLALVGHNGSGKSTLAKLSNGLLLPKLGSVFVFGQETSDAKNLFKLRKNIGIVFQNPDNQMVATIVEDDVAFGPENVGIKPAEIRQRVDNALEYVQMSKFKDRSASKLSGGQKQRIAIAGVLALLPKIIVFDESTAMLDPQGRKEILSIIKKLNRENNITIILVTHFMEEAAQADRIIVLNDGKMELEGAPREVFSQIEKLQSINLDVPVCTKVSKLLGLKIALTNEELVESINND